MLALFFPFVICAKVVKNKWRRSFGYLRSCKMNIGVPNPVFFALYYYNDDYYYYSCGLNMQIFNNNWIIFCTRMWIVPEARNIPRTSEIVDKRLKMKSEGCSTKDVSTRIVSWEVILNNVYIWFMCHY